MRVSVLFPRQNKRRMGAFGSTLVLATALATSGCQTTGSTSSSLVSSNEILEVNVTKDPTRINGQPVVVVNPKNPNNLVFISANHIPDPGSGNNAQVAEFHCYAAHSQDGGATWAATPWPYGDRRFCGDPYLAVDSEGTFYLASNRLGCPSDPTAPLSTRCPEGPGQVGVATSRDGGRTWSAPVDTPVARSTTPRLRVDRATGRVYAVGGVGAPSPQAVTVSADQGRTWSAMAPLPPQPFGNQIAVHDGILVTATAMKIVGKDVLTDEVRFYVSSDDGRSFTSLPVTDSQGAPVRPAEGALVPSNKTLVSTDPIPWVTADPTGRGRFAILLPRGDNLEVYVTGNSGKSWSGPSTIAAPGGAKARIEYGSNGELGVMWRNLGGDVANAFSAISFDGGRTFSAPLRVNRTPQRYGFGGSGGDEWSRILIEGQHAYVTWGDGRTGGSIDGIVARVPLSLYGTPRP